MTKPPRKRVSPKPKSQSAEELLGFVENLKRQWMATIDALVDPLMIVSPDYKIQKANKAMAAMAEKSIREIVGKRCFEVFANRKQPCVGCKMKQTASSGENITFDLDQIRDDRYFEVLSQPITSPDGEFEGIVQVYRDRTDSRRLQEQLIQNEKLASIGLLAGGIAHEINNPLGGILIFSQMLLRELPKDSPHYADVVEIESATQRCKAIVESLLDFARQKPVSTRGGSQKLSNKEGNEADVTEALRTALRFAKVGMKSASDIDIKENYDADETLLHGDRNRLIQLFLNLIQNAIQAMPDGGTLTIRMQNQGTNKDRYIAIDVEDTGVGIPKEHMKKIFDPFFTTKDPGEGTGLGLAICFGIVKEFGGQLAVESKLNVGTRFRIRLPLVAKQTGSTQSAS